MTFVLGDIHGNFHYIIYLLKTQLKHLKDFNIIQVGDYGVGCYPLHVDVEAHDKLTKHLAELNAHLYVIRGNHDDPDFWTEKILDYPNIHFVPDHTQMDIDGVNYFFWGGAASVDKIYRIHHPRTHPWFEGEDIDFDYPFDELKGIDVVVTHSAPSICYKPLLFDIVKKNPNCYYERIRMTDIVNVLKQENTIKKWYYGHFHDSKTDIIDGIEYNLLDINELKELHL